MASLTIESILTAVSSVGFPICICIYLIIKQNETIDKLRETIENNTKALIVLNERLGIEEKKEN